MAFLLDQAGDYIRDMDNIPMADMDGYPSYVILDMEGKPILDEDLEPMFDMSYSPTVTTRRGNLLLLGVGC
ncbi:MAG: hypothetical protein KAS32_14025 [Candidatus Peribacteraceae bacterium]|nr:hypothetical protein [Candidatus Peribacteraceae bacterium]